MKKSLHVAICLAAGFAGGMISRYSVPPVALAQSQPQSVVEVRDGHQFWSAGGPVIAAPVTEPPATFKPLDR